MQYSKQLKNLSSEHPLACKNLTIDSIGITNGCVDIESAMARYPDFAYNNTYGVRYGSEELYEEAMNNITKPDGCLDLVELCRISGEIGDPDFTGSNATVNEICIEAFYFCELNVIMSFPELNEVSTPGPVILPPIPENPQLTPTSSATPSTLPVQAPPHPALLPLNAQLPEHLTNPNLPRRPPQLHLRLHHRPLPLWPVRTLFKHARIHLNRGLRPPKWPAQH